MNENLAFNFASAADKAKWKAEGEPPLVNPSGKSGLTGPVTSNYAFGGYSYNEGAIKVSLPTAQAAEQPRGGQRPAPGSVGGHESGPRQQAAVGLTKPTYGEYVFQVAGEFAADRPGHPRHQGGGLRTAGAVQPYGGEGRHRPLGRVGIAIGNAGVGYLVIDPATADILDLTSAPGPPGGHDPGNPVRHRGLPLTELDQPAAVSPSSTPNSTAPDQGQPGQGQLSSQGRLAGRIL